MPSTRSEWINLLIIGLLMVAVGNLSVVWAEQWVPSGMAALLVATAPFWAAILEMARRGGEKISLRTAAGMLIGFLGVALLVTPGGAGRHFDARFLIGALAIQAGSFGWQYGTIRGKHSVTNVPIFVSAGWQMLLGGIVVLVVSLATGETSRLSFTTRSFAAAAYLTFVGSVIAYSAYVYAVAKLKTTTASLYAYVNPVVAVILGFLVLHEELTPTSIVAMLIILSGVALVQTAGGRRAKPPVEVTDAVAERDAA